MMWDILFDQMWLMGTIFFILAYNYITKESWKKLPPGPPALPLVGSLPFLGSGVREPLRKMARKYGDVFTVYLGPQRVVVLNEYDATYDAFVKHAHTFTGRPKNYIFDCLSDGYGT